MNSEYTYEVVNKKSPTYLHDKYSFIKSEFNKFNHVARTHAYGMLYALMEADLCNKTNIYVLEFGVSNGSHTKVLCDIAYNLSRLSGITINIVGFDTFSGLPQIQPVVDHPEMWEAGEFSTINKTELLNECKTIYSNIEFVEGDVKDTIDKFSYKKECPIGYVTIDLDLYSSTKNALKILNNDREFYLPCIPMYFDDVYTVLTYNPYCGELLAIKEFNDEHEKRKIVKRTDTSLYNFFTLHVLDHPVLTGEISVPKFNIFLD